MKLSNFNDFYKKIAKEMIDTQDLVECERVVNYSAHFKNHQFSIKVDEKLYFYMSVTVHRDYSEHIIKWEIKHIPKGDLGEFVFDESNETYSEDILLRYIMNCDSYEHKPLRSFIDDMMNGMRF